MTTDRSGFARVIAVHNGKGGVLKSTTTVNVAGWFAEHGKGNLKVLVIDLDAQHLDGALSRFFGVDEYSDGGAELYGALSEGRALNPARFLEVRDNLHLVCAGRELKKLMWHKSWNEEEALEALAISLDPVVDDYDFVFIDTPPSNDLTVLAAFGCARYVMIPTEIDMLSLDSTTGVQELIKTAATINPDIEVIGMVLTKVSANATTLEEEARSTIRTLWGSDDLLFSFRVTDASAIASVALNEGRLFHELAAQEEQRAAERRQYALTRLKAFAPAYKERRKRAKELGVEPKTLELDVSVLDFDAAAYPEAPASYAGAGMITSEMAGLSAELFGRIIAREADQEDQA